MLGRDAEDLLVGLDGLGQIGQCHFENLGQAVGEGNDLLLGVGQADLAANDLGQILPALGHGVETIEGDQPVLAIRLGLGHALEGRDGLVHLAGFLFIHAGQAQEHLDLQLAVHHAIDLGLDGGGQFGPAAAGLGHAVEMGDDLGVGRVHTHGAAVGIEGGVEIRETALVDTGDDPQKLHAPDGILRVRDDDLVGARDLVPLAGRLVDGLQHFRGGDGLFPSLHHAFDGAQGGVVGRVHLEDPPVGFRGPRGVVELLAPQLTDAMAQ